MRLGSSSDARSSFFKSGGQTDLFAQRTVTSEKETKAPKRKREDASEESDEEPRGTGTLARRRDLTIHSGKKRARKDTESSVPTLDEDFDFADQEEAKEENVPASKAEEKDESGEEQVVRQKSPKQTASKTPAAETQKLATETKKPAASTQKKLAISKKTPASPKRGAEEEEEDTEEDEEEILKKCA